MTHLLRMLGAMVLLTSIGALIPVGSASAHIPTGGTDTTNAWSSVYPHGPTTYVQLMNSLRGYSNMTLDYNNARGHLNDFTDGSGATNGGTGATPPFTDVTPGNPPTPDVLIVLAGSAEEIYINAAVGFDPCSSSTAWGKVYGANFYGSTGHMHTLDQKVCIWADRFSRTAMNADNPPLRYQYLALEHELSHVLNLADSYGHTHARLMRDGLDMHEMNTGERNEITLHY